MFPFPSTSAAPHIPFTPLRESGPLESAPFSDDDVEQIRNLPEADRWLAFKRLTDTAGARDPEQRDTRLIALTRQLEHLPQEQRWTAFELLSGASDALGEAQLATLAEQIQHLQINERLIKFNELFEINRKILGRHPAAFTRQIEHLAPEQRRDAFNRLLCDAVGLDAQQCAAHVEALGEQIRWLAHKKDRLDGFDGIVRAIERLVAAEQQGAQFVALARKILHLGSGDMSNCFRCIFNKIDGLPTGERRAAHLSTLIQENLSWMSLEILIKIEALGATQRISREACRALLAEFESRRSPNTFIDDLLKLPIKRIREDLSARELSSQAADEAATANPNINRREQPEPVQFSPEQFTLPSDALKNINALTELSRRDPAAAAGIMKLRHDGAHIGLWIAALMNRFPRTGEMPLKAYLELVDALRAGGHLKSKEVQSMLLPEKAEERHVPISMAVASHWQSGIAQPFVSTLANALREGGKEQVISRLSLEQSDRQHRQLTMRASADFYKQIKRGIANLPVDEQDTPAFRVLAGHGLIPPDRELGKIAQKLPGLNVPAAAQECD